MENSDRINSAIKLDKKGKLAAKFAKYSYRFNAVVAVPAILIASSNMMNSIGKSENGIRFGITNLFSGLLMIVILEIILFILYQPLIHYYRYFLAYKVGNLPKKNLQSRYILVLICSLIVIPFNSIEFFIGILLLIPHYIFLFENYKMLFIPKTS